jgi:hypothetical protein
MIARVWLIVAAVTGVVSFAAGWSANGWRHDAAEKAAIAAAIDRTKAEYTTRDGAFAADQARDAATTAENAKLKQEILQQAVALQDAVRGLELVRTTTKVIHDETGSHACPDIRRGTAYRVCINAALSGDAEALAACEAERGHGRMPHK